jgi:hypothetical protein
MDPWTLAPDPPGPLAGPWHAQRFDDRVLALMAHNIDVPLALSNLAARGQVSAATSTSRATWRLGARA